MANTDSEFDIKKFESLFDKAPNREEALVNMVRKAEEVERYDDMCEFMKLLVEEKEGSLRVEERNLLSVAYKNVIGAKRASFRTLSNDDQSSLVSGKYSQIVLDELTDCCMDILDLLKKQLIPKALEECDDKDWSENELELKKDIPFVESKVFYLKMTGDYYRYLAEAHQNDASKFDEFKDAAVQYYKQANDAANRLEPTHPIRLGLALNYSVCCYEIVKTIHTACEMAKKAFDLAISQLDSLSETDYKDSTLIMQLLRDNLTLWTSNEKGEDDIGVEDISDDEEN